jgi:hypothetical protein
MDDLNIDVENTNNEEAQSMDEESEMSEGSSTDDDADFLRLSKSSFEITKNSIGLLTHELMDDDGDQGRKWGEGSRIGKAPNKPRDFKGAYERLVKNYFSGTASKYNELDFERRFRMPRSVFYAIYSKIYGKFPFVESKINFSSSKGIHPLVRLTACIRRLAYGDSADRDDENLEMAESTINDSLKKFTKLMKNEFGAQYLNRCPSATEIERSTTINAGRGFPGMFASWDCKHFSWKNCPVALAGQHKGKGTDKSLVLEAIADPDLYIWYSFFGEAGSLNDINILNKSSIVASILDGSFNLQTTRPYTINGTTRDWLYFLVDGIYPPYSIFINTFHHPQTEMEKYFARCQEACRKDIERAFGVLVQRFQILQRPIKNWYWHQIVDLMDVCIILHNMVVEARRENYSVCEYMDTGRRWYAATDIFRPSPNSNDGATATNSNSTTTTMTTTTNSNSTTMTNSNSTTTTNRSSDPPVVSLFRNDEEDENILFQNDLATSIAIRVAHMNERMKCQQEHFSLKNDLMNHLWQRRSRRRRQATDMEEH